jgi:hypothetical protein
MGWRRCNLVHSANEEMLKAILKDAMINWVESHVFELGPTQDFS